MNFADFLRQRRTNKNIATAKEHYESLGGEKVLQISLRHFQQIESGKYPPSETLLAALFDKTSPSDRRALVLSYFRSVVGEKNIGGALLEYLEQHLSPAVESETKSLWDTTKKLMIYSEDQLDFLTQNTDAMRLHKRLLLLGNTHKSKVNLPKDKLKKLEDLNLIEIADGVIKPSRGLYRIPNYENSNPRAVSKASDYIMKHAELFISKEGSANQELSYAMQMVTPSVAQRILEQMTAFKKWVQSLASSEEGPNMMPFLFVGFAKQIDRKEL